MTERKQAPKGKLSPQISSTLTTFTTESKMQEQRRHSLTESQQILEMLSKMGQDISSIKTQGEQASKERELMLSRIEKLDGSLVVLQKQITETKGDIKMVKLAGKKTDQKVSQTQEELKQLKEKYQDLETSIMKTELEQAAYVLRLQNFPEKPKEVLREDIAGWLSAETGLEETLLKEGIDKIYRTGAGRARLFNTPREIFIKFERKYLRNQVLKLLEEKDRIIQEHKLIILREVPWRVRRKRLPYRKFAALLRNNQINYRWEVPEGLSFIFGTRRYNITSTLKMAEFLRKHGEELGVSREEGEFREEEQSDDDSEGRDKEESAALEEQKQELTQDETVQRVEEEEQEEELLEQECVTDLDLLGAAAPRPLRTRQRPTSRALGNFKFKNKNK